MPCTPLAIGNQLAPSSGEYSRLKRRSALSVSPSNGSQRIVVVPLITAPSAGSVSCTPGVPALRVISSSTWSPCFSTIFATSGLSGSWKLNETVGTFSPSGSTNCASKLRGLPSGRSFGSSRSMLKVPLTGSVVAMPGCTTTGSSLPLPSSFTRPLT